MSRNTRRTRPKTPREDSLHRPGRRSAARPGWDLRQGGRTTQEKGPLPGNRRGESVQVRPDPRSDAAGTVQRRLFSVNGQSSSPATFALNILDAAHTNLIAPR